MLGDVFGGGLGALGSFFGGQQMKSSAQAAGDDYEKFWKKMKKWHRPYQDFGLWGMEQYQNLMDDPWSVRGLPGYQFQMDEAQRAVDRKSTLNSYLSGQSLIDSTNRAQQMADLYFGSHLDRFKYPIGVGQTAANEFGRNTMGAADNLADLQLAYGNAQAAQTMGVTGGLSDMARGYFGSNAPEDTPPPATSYGYTGQPVGWQPQGTPYYSGTAPMQLNDLRHLMEDPRTSMFSPYSGAP